MQAHSPFTLPSPVSGEAALSDDGVMPWPDLYSVTDWQAEEAAGSHSHFGDIYSEAHASTGAAVQETSYGQPHMPTSHETVVVPRNMYDDVALDAQRVRRYPH